MLRHHARSCSPGPSLAEDSASGAACMTTLFRSRSHFSDLTSHHVQAQKAQSLIWNCKLAAVPVASIHCCPPVLAQRTVTLAGRQARGLKLCGIRQPMNIDEGSPEHDVQVVAPSHGLPVHLDQVFGLDVGERQADEHQEWQHDEDCHGHCRVADNGQAAVVDICKDSCKHTALSLPSAGVLGQAGQPPSAYQGSCPVRLKQDCISTNHQSGCYLGCQFSLKELQP